MKKLMIIPMLALGLMANSNKNGVDKEALIAEYKEMFQNISKKRIGVDESKVDNLSSPFIKVKKEEIAKVETNSSKSGFVSPFELQAIFGKRVKISGNWYKLHDDVNGLKIVSVRGNSVWLKNSEYRKKLTMGSKNEKISIK